MRNFKILFIALTSITLLTLTGCGIEEETKNNKKEKDKFVLTEDHGYADEYGFAYYIEGVVTNKTDKEYSYVQVSFNVYDADGNVIGSCLDNVNNLEANGTWRIKAICSGEANKVASYKLTEFTEW